MAAQQYLAQLRRHPRAAGRDRRRGPGVGTAQPGGLPLRRGPHHRRRRRRLDDDLDAAHRRRLLPGHRRRRRRGAHLAGAGPRPRPSAGAGARLRRAHHQHVDDRGPTTSPPPVLPGPAADAFVAAGVTPADVDVLEVYDSFTITAALTVEALGFCGRGEVLDFMADGRIRPGGALPLEHQRRRPLLLPPRPVRRAPARRGGAAAARRLRGAAGARRARSRSRTAPAASCRTHATVVLGVDR